MRSIVERAITYGFDLAAVAAVGIFEGLRRPFDYDWDYPLAEYEAEQEVLEPKDFAGAAASLADDTDDDRPSAGSSVREDKQQPNSWGSSAGAADPRSGVTGDIVAHLAQLTYLVEDIRNLLAQQQPSVVNVHNTHAESLRDATEEMRSYTARAMYPQHEGRT